MKVLAGRRKPPPAIEQLRVLAYAFLPSTLPFAGTSILLKAGDGPFTPPGRVPRLALCSDKKEVRLAFCDRYWRPVASRSYPGIASAKRAAQRAYPGSRGQWLKAGYTVADARSYIERIWARHRCLFCLKSPLDSGTDVTLFTMNRGRICSACVQDLAKDVLRREP
jgi:hypothetical protein